MPDKTALIYSHDFARFSYGDDHPFKIQRFLLAYELMRQYGLTALPGADLLDCPRATEDDLLTFHDPDYLARLREFSAADEPRADFRYGLGDLDNPVFRGLYDWACLGAGGTLEAARLVTEEGYDIAFNLAGGWHHAHRAKASGFSYLNDAVLAINRLLDKGLRVAYLDIDAHHGDGVQEAFYDSDRVLTVSIHESGIYFFPGTGFESEVGSGRGRGYSVNVPLVAHADDALFMKAFDEVAYPLIAAFNPDVLVTQLGADTFRTDPLTRLEITTHSYTYVLRKLKALKIPWVAVGGGGYNLVNVARAWTIAWGVMNGVELPPRLPHPFVEIIARMGHQNRMLLDAMHWAEEDDRHRALDAVEQSIAAIRETIFPIIIGRYDAASGE
ncbi:acetoin utilization protein AcuC [Geobacter pickeringii]|uniref:Acetoin utilization protein AcuC n=1 Tax=Geobacter pickeringii TaxID=345632 RepID=A0A0B5BGJ9_9BACT|nr:acetoin utilization protein AcuC [Geobacter pickeringii]AJE03640.1 histone deacetylase [Geobacter pickeringii]